jgi:hypothetical protein
MEADEKVAVAFGVLIVVAFLILFLVAAFDLNECVCQEPGTTTTEKAAISFVKPS